MREKWKDLTREQMQEAIDDFYDEEAGIIKPPKLTERLSLIMKNRLSNQFSQKPGLVNTAPSIEIRVDD